MHAVPVMYSGHVCLQRAFTCHKQLRSPQRKSSKHVYTQVSTSQVSSEKEIRMAPSSSMESAGQSMTNAVLMQYFSLISYVAGKPQPCTYYIFSKWSLQFQQKKFNEREKSSATEFTSCVHWCFLFRVTRHPTTKTYIFDFIKRQLE